MLEKLPVLPLTAEVSPEGHLMIGGCDTVELAGEFGTPLYLFDEFTLRCQCRDFRRVFGEHYQNSSVIYAAKAYLGTALVRLLVEEGMGLLAASGGEMGIARKAGFPAASVYLHGNNKSAEEIAQALDYGVERIVVDNQYELSMLSEKAAAMARQPAILLRLTPGIDPHTHRHIATGLVDSKFGIPLKVADEAVARAKASSHLNLVGLHFHLGSQITEIEPYRKAVEVVLKFAGEMRKRHQFVLKELDIGGGFAIRYTRGGQVPEIGLFAEAITGEIAGMCRELELESPHLVTEPGRAIVGQAGVALYRAGAIKEIPGVRCYVPVDGGMGDNIRPALYQAEYEAVVASNVRGEAETRVTIAGKFCESGDILVRDISLPEVKAGDIIAVPASGAYCLPMASNYNGSFRPAVVMVRDGQARLIRRRETLEDLTTCDVSEGGE